MRFFFVALIFVFPLMGMKPCMKLVRSEKGYNLQLNGFNYDIKSYDVDARLRSLDDLQLSRLSSAGGLRSYKMSNGDHRVELGGSLKGGGAWGAAIGAFLGKAAVSVVGHGAIAIVSGGVGLLFPPAGIAVAIALESTCGAAIEAASFAGAVAGGIALGVATGPV